LEGPAAIHRLAGIISDSFVNVFTNCRFARAAAAVGHPDGSSARLEGVIDIHMGYDFRDDQQDCQYRKRNLKDFFASFLWREGSYPPLGCGKGAQDPGTPDDIKSKKRTGESQNPSWECESGQRGSSP
jgi:hypothetical protein